MTTTYTAVGIVGESIAVQIDGKSHTIPIDAANYEAVVAAIRRKAPDDEVRAIITPAKAITTAAAAAGFELRIDTARDIVGVFFDGREINSKLADRIIAHHRAGEDITPLRNFMTKALANRQPEKIDTLFQFVESNALPIHPDGDVFAFKAVRADGMDKHSGTVLYELGKYVEPKTKPAPEAYGQCGSGLHIGGRAYVSTYGSNRTDRVFVVKVNPADFIYFLTSEGGKMRVAKMFVYAETVRGNELRGQLQHHVVMSPEGDTLERAAQRRIARKSGMREQVELEQGVKLSKATVVVDDSDVEASVAAEADKAKPKRTARRQQGMTEKEAKKGQSFVVKTNGKQHIFKKGDKEFTAKEVLEGVKKNGQRGWAKITGIARTTIQEWLKVLAAK